MTVALIVDAEAGPALEVARRLADDDVEVLLCAPSEEQARAAAETLWGEGLDSVHPRALDPRSHQSVQRLSQSVRREFGALDLLVLASGADEDRLVEALRPGRVVRDPGELL